MSETIIHVTSEAFNLTFHEETTIEFRMEKQDALSSSRAIQEFIDGNKEVLRVMCTHTAWYDGQEKKYWQEIHRTDEDTLKFENMWGELTEIAFDENWDALVSILKCILQLSLSN